MRTYKQSSNCIYRLLTCRAFDTRFPFDWKMFKLEIVSLIFATSLIKSNLFYFTSSEKLLTQLSRLRLLYSRLSELVQNSWFNFSLPRIWFILRIAASINLIWLVLDRRYWGTKIYLLVTTRTKYHAWRILSIKSLNFISNYPYNSFQSEKQLSMLRILRASWWKISYLDFSFKVLNSINNSHWKFINSH